MVVGGKHRKSFILCAREYAPPGRTGLSIGVVMFFAWFGMALGG